MSWNDFAIVRLWQVSSPDGHEAQGHQVEITGTPADPVVACRTHGCTVLYHPLSFDDQKDLVCGTLRKDGGEHNFSIACNSAKHQIHCCVDNDNGSTTGSWTADDPGPFPGDGGGGKPPHGKR